VSLAFDAAGLAAQFDGAQIAAITLMGSQGRGDAGPYSDVDLVRFLAEDGPHPPGDGSHWIDGRLVVVSTHTPASVARIFGEPEAACQNLLGLAAARTLVDRGGYFAAIQAQAHAFRWDAAMQERANRVAGEMLVGWIEEVHKGLEGLRRADTGRLLNAQFGLSWGLSTVMMVQRGVLLASDNETWAAINRALGEESTWVRLRHAAFGLNSEDRGLPLLQGQVHAGLRLYVETVALVQNELTEPEQGMTLATSARIRQFLGEEVHGAA
jgi:hypothetical protein